MSTTVSSELSSELPGTVITPGADGFDAALAATVWNGDIDRRPAAIARPRSGAEVADLVVAVRRLGLDLTVRGGGHSFAGHAVADDAVMVDLGLLDQIDVDPVSRRVSCGAGVTWAALDEATAPHALAVPGGFISHTGVAGLTLGGGLGWLSRRGGLSCDNLFSAEVAAADGRLVTASAQDNPDLFWALRGGGGNFGIVTRFEFTAHPVNPVANLGLFFWRPQDARAPLQLAREYIPTLPEDCGAFVAGLSAPPAPFVPAEHHGIPGIAVLVTNWGAPEDHADAVAPLRALEPLFELVTPIPHTALQQMFDESAPWGIRAYEKALYLDDLNDDVIDALITRIPGRASPMSFVPIFPLGGQYARVPDEDTAFGGRRSTRWAVNLAAIATDADLLSTDRSWVRNLWDELRPHAADAGGYINFLADVDTDRVRAAYGAKYARLAAIKATWDPHNVFHHNANIEPAT